MPYALVPIAKPSDLYFVRGNSAQGSYSPSNTRRGLIVAQVAEKIETEERRIGLLEISAACGTAFHVLDIARLDVEGYESSALVGLNGMRR